MYALYFLYTKARQGNANIERGKGGGDKSGGSGHVVVPAKAGGQINDSKTLPQKCKVTIRN